VPTFLAVEFLSSVGSCIAGCRCRADLRFLWGIGAAPFAFSAFPCYDDLLSRASVLPPLVSVYGTAEAAMVV